MHSYQFSKNYVIRSDAFSLFVTAYLSHFSSNYEAIPIFSPERCCYSFTILSLLLSKEWYADQEYDSGDTMLMVPPLSIWCGRVISWLFIIIKAIWKWPQNSLAITVDIFSIFTSGSRYNLPPRNQHLRLSSSAGEWLTSKRVRWREGG